MWIPQVEYPGPFTNCPALAERLAEAGLSPEASSGKAKCFARAAAALKAAGAEVDGPLATGLFVPGRIEVLGKHTDYAGGSSMVAAAQRGFSLVVVPRDDCRVLVVDALSQESVTFEFDPDIIPRAGHWANYPMTVARRLARNFPGPTRGVSIGLASDLPPAAGMSSSSALIVAVFLALAPINKLYQREEFLRNIRTPIDLAGYLATIENGQSFGTLWGDRGVGTFGGSEDHTAILTCRPGYISQYAYCPIRLQQEIPFPAGYTFAIASSGVEAEKTGAAMARYNAASLRVGRLVQLWRDVTGLDDPNLAEVVARGPAAIEYLRSIVRDKAGEESGPLLDRLEQFITENLQILPAASEALQAGELDRFGRLVDQSQRAVEQLLRNQVPETSFLATTARQLGAVAASAFGAGFGGSVWALVESSRAERFLASWAESYRGRFPERWRRSAFFLTGPGPAAFEIA
ncbi:MAG: GHMP family kinase ATP-binding protein [Thermoguttaceae bacterium]